MLKSSALEFNEKYASTTGFTFDNLTGDYYRFDEASHQYPALKFHYEFWDDDGVIYASLHTAHLPTENQNDRNLNLILKIHSFSSYIIKEIRRQFDPFALCKVNLICDEDEENTYNTHIINFVCKNDPSYNADLMHELVKATRKFKI